MQIDTNEKNIHAIQINKSSLMQALNVYISHIFAVPGLLLLPEPRPLQNASTITLMQKPYPIPRARVVPIGPTLLFFTPNLFGRGEVSDNHPLPTFPTVRRFLDCANERVSWAEQPV